MSAMLEAAVAALETRMTGGFDGSARFVIPGEGTIIIDRSGVREGDSEGDGEADVTLSADADIFQAILAGEMNPTAAFMTGKLSVDGDMSTAMKLGAALS